MEVVTVYVKQPVKYFIGGIEENRESLPAEPILIENMNGNRNGDPPLECNTKSLRADGCTSIYEIHRTWPVKGGHIIKTFGCSQYRIPYR